MARKLGAQTGVPKKPKNVTYSLSYLNKRVFYEGSYILRHVQRTIKEGKIINIEHL